jgi:hypothetical protein
MFLKKYWCLHDYTALQPIRQYSFHFPEISKFGKLLFIQKSIIFWDITLCSPPKINRRFKGIYRLQLQDRRISWVRIQCESRWQAEFDPEDGGDTFLRNIGWLSTDYMALFSQKTVLFITTAVRTQNLTCHLFSCLKFSDLLLSVEHCLYHMHIHKIKMRHEIIKHIPGAEIIRDNEI